MNSKPSRTQVRSAESSGYTQLNMQIKVSRWQSFLIPLRKSLREFRFSPVMQLVQNFMVWVHVGIVGAMGIYLYPLRDSLPQVSGVVLPGAAASLTTGLIETSYKPLSVLLDYWYLMVGFAFVIFILCIPLLRFGKVGLVNYLLVISLVIQLLLVKIIVTPILVIGL